MPGLTLKYSGPSQSFTPSLLARSFNTQMIYAMGNALRNEKSKFNKHTSTTSTLQTPPRTPTLTAISSQALASRIRGIYDALSELPDLTPGDRINALLTCLVSLCIVPYSHEFTTYFFNIEGIHTLCEQLRPLCATAEGELERFWAKKIIDESLQSQGPPTSHTSLPHKPKPTHAETPH